MNPSEIVRTLLQRTGTTQQGLAEMLGYTSQGTVSNRLKSGNMTAKVFFETVDVLGYEVIIRPKAVPNATDLEIVASKE